MATRGGGLLLMGGMESFDKRRFASGTARGVITGLCIQSVGEAISPDVSILNHSRRIVATLVAAPRYRSAEQQRLAMLPRFNTVNPIGGIKPGAISGNRP